MLLETFHNLIGITTEAPRAFSDFNGKTKLTGIDDLHWIAVKYFGLRGMWLLQYEMSLET